MEKFETDEEVENHLRLPQQCPLKLTQDDDWRRGFNKIQEAQVRKRSQKTIESDKIRETQMRSGKRRGSHQTEEEKWRYIYLILFPDQGNSIPSPCRFFSNLKSIYNCLLTEFRY
jgi:hypothetical protein